MVKVVVVAFTVRTGPPPISKVMGRFNVAPALRVTGLLKVTSNLMMLRPATAKLPDSHPLNPPHDVLFHVTPVTVGAAVSMVRVRGFEAVLVFPAASVAVMVRARGPGVRAGQAVTVCMFKLQLPSDPATTAQEGVWVPSTSNRIVLLASTDPAAPRRMGLVTLVMPSPSVPESLALSKVGALGAAGGVASRVKLKLVDVVLFPAASVAVAV